MKNKKLITFEVIENTVDREPEAIDKVFIMLDISSICLFIGDISMTTFKTV